MEPLVERLSRTGYRYFSPYPRADRFLQGEGSTEEQCIRPRMLTPARMIASMGMREFQGDIQPCFFNFTLRPMTHLHLAGLARACVQLAPVCESGMSWVCLL